LPILKKVKHHLKGKAYSNISIQSQISWNCKKKQHKVAVIILSSVTWFSLINLRKMERGFVPIDDRKCYSAWLDGCINLLGLIGQARTQIYLGLV
jgi:hypothetical protein